MQVHCLYLRLHPEGAVDPEDFSIDVAILDDVLDQGGVLVGNAKAGRERYLCGELALHKIREKTKQDKKGKVERSRAVHTLNKGSPHCS